MNSLIHKKNVFEGTSSIFTRKHYINLISSILIWISGILFIYKLFDDPALKIILYSIDPEIIILGGSVSKAFNLYQSSMNESINSFTYSKAKNNLKIVVSEIENISILGAAALYIDAQSSN